MVVVLVDKPHILIPLANSIEILDARKRGSINAPEPSLCGSVVAAGKEDLVRLIRQLLEVIAVIQDRISFSHLERDFVNVADRVGRITVVKAHLVVQTAPNGAVDREIHILDGTNLITAVKLPSLAGSHGASAKH